MAPVSGVDLNHSYVSAEAEGVLGHGEGALELQSGFHSWREPVGPVSFRGNLLEGHNLLRILPVNHFLVLENKVFGVALEDVGGYGGQLCLGVADAEEHGGAAH